MFKVTNYRIPESYKYTNRYNKDRLDEYVDRDVARLLAEVGLKYRKRPRSVYRVQGLYDALERFHPGRIQNVNLSQPAVKHGIKLAYAAFARPELEKHLQPLDYHNPLHIAKIVKKMSASAGATNWHKSKRDSIPQAIQAADRILRNEKVPEPCVANARTQYQKTRLVWCYPFSMMLIEGMFARPIIDNFVTLQTTPMALGMMSGALGAKLRAAQNDYTWTYSVDMSSYDASIARNLINIAFDIIQTWYPEEYNESFHIIRTYFIYTPIIMPDACKYQGKRHGVPSGSYFTQIVDSIVNVIIAGAISYVLHLNVDKDRLLVLGDDLVMFTDTDVKLSRIAKVAEDIFGVKFNADKSMKCHWSQPIHFLGREWDRGIPDVELQDLVDKIVQPESYRKYPKKEKARELAALQVIYAYASVYRCMYSVYSKIASRVFGKRQFPSLIESSMTMAHAREEDLSGLVRYYVREGWLDYGNQSNRGYKPLFYLFWL